MSWLPQNNTIVLFPKKFTQNIFEEEEKVKTNTFYLSKSIKCKMQIRWPIIVSCVFVTAFHNCHYQFMGVEISSLICFVDFLLSIIRSKNVKISSYCYHICSRYRIYPGQITCCLIIHHFFKVYQNLLAEFKKRFIKI